MHDIENNRKPPAPRHVTTIFAQFENELLKNRLMDWADKNDCGIVWGDGEDDLLACGSFVEIIDRQVVPEATYDWYVRWSRGEDIPIKIGAIYMETEDGQFIDMKNEIDKSAPDPDRKPLYDYIEWDQPICIIIDNRRDLELPHDRPVLCVNLEEHRSTDFILNAVQMAKEAGDQELRRNGYI